MRLGAVLVLSALACLACAPPAGAATYCAGPVPAGYGCAASLSTIQGALDAAGSNPGADSVRIADGAHVLGTGLTYSDLGQPANEVFVGSGARCDKTSCRPVTLAGGAPGDTLLAFGGGGAAKVTVESLHFAPSTGATGLMLPPGGEARVEVDGADGSTGIRTVGSLARPAVIWASVRQHLGGARDIAIDALGETVIQFAYIRSDVAARSSGSNGLLRIRDSVLIASTGITGRDAWLTRSLLDLREGSAPRVGLEAICPDANAPDSELTATNVTLLANSEPDTTGARAIARGGDGDSCDAAVRLNSTILYGVATSLDAVGQPGTGGDPRDGTARFEPAYSNFDPALVRQSGPTDLELSTPGGNVYGDPRFRPSEVPSLSWDSPLIDSGDPAPPGPDDANSLPTLKGRRDIGLREYQFDGPHVSIATTPSGPVRVGRPVRLRADGVDFDGDPLQVRWDFSNGDMREYAESDTTAVPSFTRRYSRPGSYAERVTVTDPTGRSSSTQATVEVRRQRMLRLALVPRRLRATRDDEFGRTKTVIQFMTRAVDTVYFRVERGVPRRQGRGLRWVRTPGRFKANSDTYPVETSFNGWVGGHRLRPGRYRLRASPRGVRPLYARFRILR